MFFFQLKYDFFPWRNENVKEKEDEDLGLLRTEQASSEESKCGRKHKPSNTESDHFGFREQTGAVKPELWDNGTMTLELSDGIVCLWGNQQEQESPR